MKTLFSILSIIMLLSSMYNFYHASVTDDSVKRLLYSNLGCTQLIIGASVVGKIKEDWGDL